ncbi:MAG TPA: T9SS type A sorting domain-containing protein [Bacteroidia bacterium]|nr:T9SS type A sorting domain-containing protein [Bacteroidia bacterium]
MTGKGFLFVLLFTFFNAFAVLNAQYVSLPYADDFDSGAPGWVADTTNTGTVWQLGSPGFGATSSTHSGSNCWDINLNSGYNNGAYSTLNSPGFNLGTQSAVQISFWQNFKTETIWDGHVLQYCTDTAIQQWITVGSVNAPFSTNWYSDTLVSSGMPGWSGNSGGWIHSEIVFPNPSVNGHVWFRFLFTSDLSVTFDGVSIDDFSINRTNYNTISGTVYLDVNANQVLDAGDTTLQNVVISTVPAFSSFYYLTNALGNYTVIADSATAVTVAIVQPPYSTVSPASYTIALPGSGIDSSGNNFLVTFTPGITDPSVQITSPNFRPGFTHHKYISYGNVGTSPVSGTVEMTYDPMLQLLSASDPSTPLTANSVEFTYSNLLPGETRVINCLFYADTALAIGTVTAASAIIYPIAGDPNSANNYDTTYSTTVNSVDPNDKMVYPAGDIPVAAINSGMDLDYVVNFQNTGSAPAININILDPIDDNLDLSTFRLTSSSHPVSSWFIDANRMLWLTFKNIFLPDSTTDEAASHGYFSYSIEPYHSLVPGQTINNTAYIYFDNNLPVITNTTVNTIVIPTSVNTLSAESKCIVYPNPVSDQITFFSPEGYNNWVLLNAMGQVCLSGNLNAKAAYLTHDVSLLPDGIYFIEITGFNKAVLHSSFVIHR